MPVLENTTDLAENEYMCYVGRKWVTGSGPSQTEMTFTKCSIYHDQHRTMDVPHWPR